MEFEHAAEGEFEWHQSARRAYQLLSRGQEIASLRFEKTCGSLATGMQDQDRWTFKRTGFLAPRITVRTNGSDVNFAEFTPNWCGGGSVIFASGHRYQLHKTNFWGTSWAFEAPDGTAAVTLSGPSGFLKQSGNVQVAKGMATSPETPVLVMLIWYVRLLMNEDAAAVAVIAATG